MEHAHALLAMLTADPQSLVGTTVLSDLRVDSLLRVDAALATYAATSQPDGMECTLRVALAVPLPPERDEAVSAALQRLSRHIVGIFAICTPRAAGPVQLGADRLLAVAHVGSPRDSAEDRIASSQPLALAEILAFLGPIASALTTLHDQGLVHGALHPGALRLSHSGPILSAFGLSEFAILLGGSSAARDIVPPRSRVPEQVGIVPASPTPESDNYALAMIACELLAARPFTSETDTSCIARAIDHPMVRPTPRSLSIDVPDHVEKAFEVALRPQPRERTATPKAFLAALASPDSPQAPPPSLPRREPAPAPPVIIPRPQRSAFGAPPAPIEQPKADSAVWLVYAMVALGLLLLVGGAATVFVLAQHRVPPVVVPVTTAPLIPTALPAPTLLPSSPTAPAPEPEPTASVAPSTVPTPHPLAVPSPSSSTPRSAVASGLAYYPDDLTALVPLAKETPTLGSRDAPVTVLVFADMQCPHTRQAREVLEAMRRRYDADLRIAVRHLPIPSHDKADAAAEIAATTGALSGPIAFWKLFETLTVNQGSLTDDDMFQWAEQAGAQRLAVRRAVEEHVYARIVDADRAVAQRLMVRATPTYFINGKRADGEQSQTRMVELIDKELLASRGALTSGTPRSRLYTTRVTFNVTAGAADPPRDPTPRRRP